MIKKETISVKDENTDQMVTLDHTVHRVTFLNINTVQVQRTDVEGQTTHTIGIDGVRRVRNWLKTASVQQGDNTTFVVQDSMSGVPYQLIYASIKEIDWQPGPLDKLNRTAVVRYKNGTTMTFNLSNKAAELVVNWMMSNGAIHGHVPERRSRPMPVVTVPPGFKLVPDAPTTEWVESVLHSWGSVSAQAVRETIRLLLDAAPLPPISLEGFYDGPLGVTHAEPVDDSGIVRMTVQGYDGPERRKGGAR